MSATVVRFRELAAMGELQERGFDAAIKRDAKAGTFGQSLAEVTAKHRAGHRVLDSLAVDFVGIFL